MSEPHFYTSVLPWHNIFYWYARTDLASLLIDNPKVSYNISHICVVIKVQLKIQIFVRKVTAEVIMSGI